MDDLQIAKQRLQDKNLTLVFVKDSQIIFETNTEGLRGFLQAIDTHGETLANASAADKIIGKAAALLCVHTNIKAAYAATISQTGLQTLKKHNIHIEYQTLVPTILNNKKTNTCPFEKLVQKTNNPKQAYKKIKQQCQQLTLIDHK